MGTRAVGTPQGFGKAVAMAAVVSTSLLDCLFMRWGNMWSAAGCMERVNVPSSLWELCFWLISKKFLRLWVVP